MLFRHSKKIAALVLSAALLTSGLTAVPAFAADTSSGSSQQTTESVQSAGSSQQGSNGSQGQQPPSQPPDASGNSSGNGGTPPSLPDGAYSDVSPSDWFFGYVNYVTQKEIMTSTTGSSTKAFHPDKAIGRGDFILALYKAAGSPSVSKKTKFEDVSNSSDYYKAVCWAEEEGIANGISTTEFNPEGTLTREMAAAFINRALKQLNLTEKDTSSSTLKSYKDTSDISSWAKDSMAELVALGLLQGDDQSRLLPQSGITNAQAAAILARALGYDPSSEPSGGQGGPGGNGGQPPSQNGQQNGQPGGNGSSTSAGESQGSAKTTIDSSSDAANVSDKTYESSTADENALRVNGTKASLSGITVTKTGDTSSQDNSNFYGDNAGILATNGAAATIKNAKITTDASGGNAVFSYGSGTTVNISDSEITTSKDNSGGIQTAGGGTTNAENLKVNTSGNSAAAIRSDRGGGTVKVTKGTYKTSGTGSPAVYSTADVTVNDAKLSASNSEAVVVEGKNSVTLNDCDTTGNMTGTYNDSNENIHNIMIYQSMSGDADEGTASFTAKDGSITSGSGDMFYVTNTDAKISLENVKLTNNGDGNFLTVAGNNSSRGWGAAGSNGGNVTLNAKDQDITGDIDVDTISTLNISLADGSTYKGAMNIVRNESNGTAVGNNIKVTLSEDSTWTLTGDCTVSTLEDTDSTYSNINFNGHTITLADGTVLSGSSK